MLSKNPTSFTAIILWASLFLCLSCSSNDEPGPVDCTTSNLTLTFTSLDPTSCGTKNGSITASATGGDEPYQFAIDAASFGATANFSGLGAGTYQLKLKDKNGCERSSSVTLKPFGSSLTATTQITDSGCKTSNGTLTINASGGTGPYSYKLNNGTASASNTFGSLAVGSYTVNYTDNTGCSITQTVQVLSGIKFSADIKNIIDTNCAIAGCHVAGGSGPGNFSVFANIQANASAIRRVVQSGNMPKNAAKLPQAQLDAIDCWVDDGALNN